MYEVKQDFGSRDIDQLVAQVVVSSFHKKRHPEQNTHYILFARKYPFSQSGSHIYT